MTYTVVAWDRPGNSIGLGTVSHSAAVLTKVLVHRQDAEVEVLVASQAFSSSALGSAAALKTLAGADPQKIGAFCAASEGGSFRQVVLVSSRGTLAAYTGAGCLTYAGDRVDSEAGVAIGGNMLVDRGVLEAAYDAFRAAPGPLDARILAALDAAGSAGGDFRGDRSAGLVIRDQDGPGLDVRVDDHDRPHTELRRLRDLAHKRAGLADCYAWAARGCRAAEAAVLATRLLPDSDDLDIAAWLWAVTTHGRLTPAVVSAEAEALGTELLTRLVDRPAERASNR